MGGKDVLAEDPVKAGVDPIGQRRLLKVADSVDLGGDQVACFGHMLRHLGVRGIGVVEQRRGKERGKLNGGEDRHQKGPCSQRGRRLLSPGNGSGFNGHRHGCQGSDLGASQGERPPWAEWLGGSALRVVALSSCAEHACGRRSSPSTTSPASGETLSKSRIAAEKGRRCSLQDSAHSGAEMGMRVSFEEPDLRG